MIFFISQNRLTFYTQSSTALTYLNMKEITPHIAVKIDLIFFIITYLFDLSIAKIKNIE